MDVSDRAQVRNAVEGWNTVVRTLRSLPQATVAAVHGAAYGGGANLRLAADIVIAGESMGMCQSYADIGSSADLGASWRLPRLVGAARGRRLLMTAEVVTAQRACELADLLGGGAFASATSRFEGDVD